MSSIRVPQKNLKPFIKHQSINRQRKTLGHKQTKSSQQTDKSIKQQPNQQNLPTPKPQKKEKPKQASQQASKQASKTKQAANKQTTKLTRCETTFTAWKDKHKLPSVSRILELAPRTRTRPLAVSPEH